MAKYKKKPIIIEAVQWHKHGDHSCVIEIPDWHLYRETLPNHWMQFGYIKTLEGDYIVTPGDWIIKGVNGEMYPCKSDIFEQTYDAVQEEKTGFTTTIPTHDLKEKVF